MPAAWDKPADTRAREEQGEAAQAGANTPGTSETRPAKASVRRTRTPWLRASVRRLTQPT
jgi:hypothetical protein